MEHIWDMENSPVKIVVNVAIRIVRKKVMMVMILVVLSFILFLFRCSCDFTVMLEEEP